MSVFPNEVQDGAVEDVRLFPVSRVAGFRYDDGFGVLDARGEHPHDGWRCEHVGVAGEQHRRHHDGFEKREGDAVLERLRGRRRPGRAAEVFELNPPARTFGVAGPIRRRHLAQLGGHRGEFGRADAASELDERFVLHAADAVGDDEAAEALWKGQRGIERDEAARRRADQVESIDVEVVHQGDQIVGGRAGGRAGRGLGPAPAAAVEGNHAETGLRERRDLVFPGTHAARGSVQQHDGDARATRVDIKQPHARKIRMLFGDVRRLPARSSRRQQQDRGQCHQSRVEHPQPLFPSLEPLAVAILLR